MSYKLNKTDGSLLVELQDGVIDTTSSDLTLVGRNYKGFGEYINENYIALLENFASTSAPSNPISGQLWYDTSDQRLKIYNGTTFRVAGGPSVGASQPNMIAGDLWINNEENKLYFYDGTDLVAVGPNYTATQGKTTLEAVTMIDTSGQTRAILAQYIQGNLVGIFSKAEFTPRTEDVLLPYAAGRVIKVGFNPLNEIDNGDIKAFRWNGIAKTAENLVDSIGTSYSFADFVRTNERDSSNLIVDQTMDGGLFVKGETGLKVGYGDTQYGIFKTLASDTKTVIDLVQQNKDFAIRRKVGNDQVEALTLDTSTGRFGINNNTPTVELDVTGSGKFSGDLTVGGNLSITGTTFAVDTVSMRIKDPQLNLGVSEDSTELTDSQVDGGGFIVNSLNGSKDFIWRVATGNFTSNQNIDLELGKQFRINNSTVLTGNTLGSGVLNSSLQNLGTLTSLTVAGNAAVGSLSSPGALNISSTGDITINTQKITGVASPTADADVANKGYVDTAIGTEVLVFSLDITGFTDPNAIGVAAGPINDVKAVIQSLYPAAAADNGKQAKIHTTSYASATVSGINISIGASPDATKVLQKSSIAVDAAGTQNQTVVQDIAATNTASGTVSLTPTRNTMTFTITGGVWTHNSTVAYP
tara:strand:- start:2219 stop:4141 length:1923 start_codon:yes stop_codon:yes gene_type:complete